MSNMKKIVIAGGGFAGVELYKTLHKKLHGSPAVRFQMVSDKNYFLFYPMLHEVATGSVERNHITQPLREIVNCCVETVTETQIQKIDVAQKKLVTDSGEINYDYLVVALGVRPNYFGIPGAHENCTTFKSIDDAVVVRNQLIDHFEKAAREKDAAVRKELLATIIIGGGPSGVELAGQISDLIHTELRELYQEVDIHEASITLIDAGDRLLRQMHPSLSAAAAARLQKMGVTIMLNAQLEGCTKNGVTVAGSGELRAGLRVWAAGMESSVRGLVAAELLAAHGGLATTASLQLVGHPEVFVIGDVAEIVFPEKVMVPQTAQAATAEAAHAAQNMYNLLTHQPVRPFKFVSKGDIVPIGDWFAVGQLGAFRFSGRIMWIIRRYVFLQRMWSLRNRTKVCLDWIMRALMRRDTSRL